MSGLGLVGNPYFSKDIFEAITIGKDYKSIFSDASNLEMGCMD